MNNTMILEQLRGIFDAFQMLVSLGMLLSFIVHLSESVDRGWCKRPPDGYIAGVVEPTRAEDNPSFLGVVPEALAGGISIFGGIVLYTAISMAVIWAVFFSSLFLGKSFSTQPYLYLAAALGLVYTIYLQGELRRAVDFSGFRIDY